VRTHGQRSGPLMTSVAFLQRYETSKYKI
jgi:hypothetical protein